LPVHLYNLLSDASIINRGPEVKFNYHQLRAKSDKPIMQSTELTTDYEIGFTHI